ncbi:Bptf bromo in complex with histone H4k16ac form I, partial [Zopfochytrium polystomum]
MGPGVPTADGSALTPSDLRECRSILQSLLRHPLAWPFLAPVDPVAAMAPDYFDVVKKPMDLSSINQKLSSSRASSSIGFVADIRLMLDNCFLYNPPVNQIHQLGRSLEAHFISLVQRSFP